MRKYNKDLSKRLNCRFTVEQFLAITLVSNTLHCSRSDFVRICVISFLKEHSVLKVDANEN